MKTEQGKQDVIAFIERTERQAYRMVKRAEAVLNERQVELARIRRKLAERKAELAEVSGE